MSFDTLFVYTMAAVTAYVAWKGMVELVLPRFRVEPTDFQCPRCGRQQMPNGICEHCQA